VEGAAATVAEGAGYFETELFGNEFFETQSFAVDYFETRSFADDYFGCDDLLMKYKILRILSSPNCLTSWLL